jgi:BirA family biotin operon repressor/biotin-[acetyl-CoA-carboxylase] ligase
MIAAPADVVEAQALLLCELGAQGGEIRLSDPRLAPLAGRTLEAALRALKDSRLVALPGDGSVRRGPRGSLLNAAEIEASLAGSGLGHTVEIHASVRSTNELVLDRAGSGAGPGLVVVAEHQSAGRGRLGRRFASAPGLGIWSTTLLEPPRDPGLAPRLSLLAAVAVCRAIEAETGAAPRVKWPNDVRLNGRKLAGILVEARTRGPELFAVAGIGVNVHHLPADFPAEVRESAGSVEGETGVPVERGRLLAAILREAAAVVEAARSGSPDLPELFARFDEMRGGEVLVRERERSWRGEAAGVAPDGSFVLALPGGGTRLFRSADASVQAEDAGAPRPLGPGRGKG